jgi:hypothetical protein
MIERILEVGRPRTSLSDDAAAQRSGSAPRAKEEK